MSKLKSSPVVAASDADHQFEEPTDQPIPPRDISRCGSSKLQDHHLSRAAIVYVRQSTTHQALIHTESTERQYALVHRAVQLGWSGSTVEVIDEDQGLSGTTAEGRLGFQRLLAEVGLNHVGIILGTEMSRLARSNKDWHQLIELCAIFRTLLADQDGLYDPTDYNDRLLLGLRGMMSEAEIHLLQGRMHEALLNKARRGDLYTIPPVGYVKPPSGGFTFDPDEQAQAVIRLIFDTFDRLGSMRRVMRYLQAQDIKLPIRPHAGPDKGELEWRRATRGAVRTVLMHPLYAGIYIYGRKQTDKRRQQPGRRQSGRISVEPDQYHALIPDHCPAYITRQRYERNQERIRQNRIMTSRRGPAREGAGLLGGILFCGHCQRRMYVHYVGQANYLRYVCMHGKDDVDKARCPSISGRQLDDLISEKLLLALEPAALELSIQATDDLQQERTRLDRDWRQRLERGRYEVDRTRRQFNMVEPENRLVARQLERQWEQALQRLEQLEQNYARFRLSQPVTLTDDERSRIQSLSKNLPALWHATTTTGIDRQRIVRLLIERVVAHAHDASDHVDVEVHWSGGFTSQHELIRPVQGYSRMGDYQRLIERVESLRRQGLTFSEIAEHLNQEGFRPAGRAKQFHLNIVSRLFRKLRQQRPSAQEIARQESLGQHEWFARTLAVELQMPKNTVMEWIRRGWIYVVRQLPGYRGRKICWADTEELQRLKKLRDTKRTPWDSPLPPELITPKVPPPRSSCRRK